MGRLWRDRRGMTALQFIVVLPVFVLVVIGLWAFYSVYSARDALCDATREATRYLQVEGPRFPEDWTYPDDWEVEARKIIETELRSQRWYDLVPVNPDEVLIFPEGERRAPKDMSEVSEEEVSNNWFFVRVTKAITNPVAIFLPDQEEPGRLTLSCQSTGFYEDNPIKPSAGPPRGPRPQCPPIVCPPGPPPPTVTPCPIGQTCPPTPCPCS
ncbi:MAG: TadE/TadG family type IV pilus assembly protein [Anaerolineae bacterium]